MNPSKRVLFRVALLGLVGWLANASVAVAQTQSFTAVAAVRNADGATASVPVTIEVRRFATDAERDEVLAALQRGGTGAARTLLAGRDDAGTLQFGPRRVAIKYAYVRTTGDGQLITVVSAEPIQVESGAVSGGTGTVARVGLAVIEVMKAGAGHGELITATAVKANAEQRTIVTDDTGARTITLSNVMKK